MLGNDNSTAGKNTILMNADEGGLHAPSHLKGWRKWWWWFDFVVLVKLARLRFIAILVVIGIVITQWDLLVAFYDKWTRPAATDAAARSGTEYFCPMHPTVVRNNAKDKCPICFMPLSKRKAGEAQEAVLPAGVVNRVQLTPYRVTLAGVQTYKVDFVPLSKQLTAVGFVEFNEGGQRTVAARFKARIDKLIVNETGRMVQEGEELAAIYSPELIVAANSLIESQKAGNQELLTNTRKRLQYLGIGDDQLTEILSTGVAATQLKIRSPIRGHVITKYVREGEYIDEGMPLFELADLSTVWIQAQVYEEDLAFISSTAPDNELEATATTRAFPDESFQGKLELISPHADQETRTVSVRFKVDNPEYRLRPGITATVTLQVMPQRMSVFSSFQNDPTKRDQLAEGRVLAIPEAAVIDTGSQRIVYRQASPGVYEGVLVTLGHRMNGPDNMIFFPVLRGLQPGDVVVAAGSFLVDAETRLNPAVGSIYFGGSSGSQAQSNVNVRPTTPEDSEANENAALAKLSPADRAIVDAQKFCPVLPDSRLGSMGPPVKLVLEGQPVFLCCEGCRKRALADPKKTLATVAQITAGKSLATDSPASTSPVVTSDEEKEIAAALSELSADDRRLAQAQRFCAVMSENRLGSMGPPVKVLVNGEPIFLCCEGCQPAALKDAEKTVALARKLIAENARVLR